MGVLLMVLLVSKLKLRYTNLNIWHANLVLEYHVYSSTAALCVYSCTHTILVRVVARFVHTTLLCTTRATNTSDWLSY
jgi:hypothetical protein